MAQQFTHPHFGHEARLEIKGCEVRLTFVANTPELASSFGHEILRQLKAGAINITMMGTPTEVKGSLS